ncbi:MAG: hypothetical protein EOO48_12070, partial [Flavobacterium sp.]
MKARFKYFIPLFLISAFLTYGFIRLDNVSVPSSSSTPQAEIIGTWILEGDEGNTRVFSADGHAKIYINGRLQSDDKYTISDKCGGAKDAGGSLFLRTIDSEDAAEYCDIINGINENGSKILSLTSDNG